MIKKVSLSVTDESYERLAALSSFYKQDIKDAIISILDLVGVESPQIMHLSKEYKVPTDLSMVMSHVFFAGFDSLRTLFNKILENLEVKGLYTLGDLDIDLDEKYMWFSYDALVGYDLQIENFYVTLEPGLATLTTNSYIEVEKKQRSNSEAEKNHQEHQRAQRILRPRGL